MLEQESSVFKNPIRVQLTTSNSRTDTYISHNGEYRVFVKGPFRNENKVRIPVLVSHLKMLICGNHLPILEYDIIKCAPDLFPNCPLGVRRKLPKDKGAYFIRTRDLTWPLVQNLPTISKSSKKWKDEEVIDWDKIRIEYNIGPVIVNDIRNNYDLMSQYVLNVLFRWIIGAHIDLADRNFFLSDDKIYSVDEDYYMKFDKTIHNALTKSSFSYIYEFLLSHYENILPYIEQWMDNFLNNQTRMLVLLDNVKNYDIVISRINILKQKELVLSIFQNKKKRKDVYIDNNFTYKRSNIPDIIITDELDRVYKEYPFLMDKNIHEDRKRYISKAICSRFNGRSSSGVFIDICKSDMQKSIRRGNVRQALKAFFEVYCMLDLFPNNRVAKAQRTNIINRLMICSVEDIGVSNLDLVNEILNTCMNMQRKRDMRNPAILASLIEAACLSKKTRLSSHLWHAYGYPDNRYISQSYDIIYKDICKKTLVDAIKQGDPNIFGYAFKIKDNKKEISDMFNTISTLLHHEFLETLMKFYKVTFEKRACLQLILTIIVFKGSLSNIDNKSPPLKERWRKTITLSNLLSGDYTYTPLDISIDKHTRTGRINGSDRSDFVNMGSVIENEDKTYYDQTLYEIYKNSKMR